ncbi:hypothetical protein C8F04DRAFT_1238820 [Mycena alexandri]|uniref:Uncharacterized protein n=1 Tax=Mycena alexandri TaxID=1745969 RepID=A0AAD6SFZ5_9AGAR|nr:hypothetical protein C8F04DRAFT_1238820 [Mycena alexandri]
MASTRPSATPIRAITTLLRNTAAPPIPSLQLSTSHSQKSYFKDVWRGASSLLLSRFVSVFLGWGGQSHWRCTGILAGQRGPGGACEEGVFDDNAHHRPLALPAPPKTFLAPCSLRTRTLHALQAHVFGALAVLAVHVALNPAIPVFLHSRKHPYTPHPTLLLTTTTQILFAALYAVRATLRDVWVWLFSFAGRRSPTPTPPSSRPLLALLALPRAGALFCAPKPTKRRMGSVYRQGLGCAWAGWESALLERWRAWRRHWGFSVLECGLSGASGSVLECGLSGARVYGVSGARMERLGRRSGNATLSGCDRACRRDRPLTRLSFSFYLPPPPAHSTPPPPVPALLFRTLPSAWLLGAQTGWVWEGCGVACCGVVWVWVAGESESERMRAACAASCDSVRERPLPSRVADAGSFWADDVARRALGDGDQEEAEAVDAVLALGLVSSFASLALFCGGIWEFCGAVFIADGVDGELRMRGVGFTSVVMLVVLVVPTLGLVPVCSLRAGLGLGACGACDVLSFRRHFGILAGQGMRMYEGIAAPVHDNRPARAHLGHLRRRHAHARPLCLDARIGVRHARQSVFDILVRRPCFYLHATLKWKLNRTNNLHHLAYEALLLLGSSDSPAATKSWSEVFDVDGPVLKGRGQGSALASAAAAALDARFSLDKRKPPSAGCAPSYRAALSAWLLGGKPAERRETRAKRATQLYYHTLTVRKWLKSTKSGKGTGTGSKNFKKNGLRAPLNSKRRLDSGFNGSSAAFARGVLSGGGGIMADKEIQFKGHNALKHAGRGPGELANVSRRLAVITKSVDRIKGLGVLGNHRQGLDATRQHHPSALQPQRDWNDPLAFYDPQFYPSMVSLSEFHCGLTHVLVPSWIIAEVYR